MMRLLHQGSARPSRPIFITLLSVAPFTGLLALSAASTQDTPPSRQQTQARTEAPEKLDILEQSHAAFRRSVLSEFERAAPLRNVHLDTKSLVITSCNDGAMIAGLSVSPRMDVVPERSDIVKQERTPPSQQTDPNVRDSGTNPREVVGMVAISGNFLGVRSSPVDASTGRPIPGATTPDKPFDTTLDQGFYLVRRDPSGNGLQLINRDERIVVTVPYHHARTGLDGQPSDAQGRPQGMAMGDIGEWPKIYMAILHAIEPRFSG